MVNFFEFIAEEVRELLAEMGLRTLEEAIGHAELLAAVAPADHPKAAGLDLSRILCPPPAGVPLTCVRKQDHDLERTLDAKLIEACRAALDDGSPVRGSWPVANSNRAVGTMLGSEVTRRYGEAGLPPGTIELELSGSAGQSFGAFLPRGVTLRLFGDANDYLGKGLSGGRIVVRPAARRARRFRGRGQHNRRQCHRLRRHQRGDLHPRRRRASVFAYAIRAPWPSSRAWATTVAST